MKQIYRRGIGVFIVVTCLLAAGCATPSGAPTKEYSGIKVLKELDKYRFLECIQPEAIEVTERTKKINSMDTYEFHRDRSNVDRPAEVKMPVLYTLPLTAFNDGLNERSVPGPHLVLQLKVRRRQLIGKTYIKTTQMSSGYSKYETVQFPRYYDYAWYPDCKVLGKRTVHFYVEELRKQPGLISEGWARLDDNGQLSFSLLTFSKEGVKQPEGLTFVFNCATEDVRCKIFVPRDIFREYQ